MERRPFYLFLPSNTIHPARENKTSNFFIQLPRKLILKGEWEVGLTEIHIPVSWYNFPEIPRDNRAIVVKRDIIKPKKGSSVTPSPTGVLTDTETHALSISYIPYGNYENIQDLIKNINLALEKINVQSSKAIIKQRKYPFIKTEEENLKPVLRVEKGDFVYLSFHLASLLRLKIPTSSRLFRQGTDWALFRGPALISSSGSKQNLNTFISSYVSFHDYKAGSVPSLDSFSRNIYVYTNIIENNTCGNVEVPLLRSIRCTKKFGEEIKEIFTAPHYKKIKSNEIQEIHIEIYDDAGEHIRFQYGKVFLVLHLKPKSWSKKL